MKSIRPIQPVATSMPAKSVAPMTSTRPTTPISMAPLRGVTASPLRALPQIGPGKSDTPDTRRNELSGKSDFSSYAFMSLTRFMPGVSVTKPGVSLNSSYVSQFATFDDFFKGISNDFGAGVKKTFKTADGDQDLYDYQYQNLLKYGNINGPRTLNEFTFRNGYWWSTAKPNVAYDKLTSNPNDPNEVEFGLSASEDEALHSMALKNRLTAQQYADLRTAALSKKYSASLTAIAGGSKELGQSYEALSAKLKPYLRTLETGVKLYETPTDLGGKYRPLPVTFSEISTMARYGSVFGDGDPGIAFLGDMNRELSAISNSLATEFTPVLGAAASAGAYYLAPLLGLGSIPGIGVILAAVYGLYTGITALKDVSDAHRNYDLVNANGYAIDNFNMITSKGDRKGIEAIAKASGKSKDAIASILGALYRYRVIKSMGSLFSDWEKARDLYSSQNTKYNAVWNLYKKLPSSSYLS